MKKSIVKMLISMVVLMVFATFSYSQTAASADKDQLIAEIVEQTFSAFPMEVFETEIEKAKTQGVGKIKDEIPQLLISKAEANPDFSVEKKAAIRAKVPEFGERFGDKVTEVISKDLNITLWIKEAFAENFAKNFTVAELKKINLFMKGENGRAFFEAVKEQASAKIDGRTSQTDSNITDKEAIDIEKFMKSPLGVKFMDFFGKDTEAFLDRKIENWSNNMLKNIEESMKTGELGEMLKQFIVENFS